MHLKHMPRAAVKGDSATGWVHFEFSGIIRGTLQVRDVKRDYKEQVFRRRVMGYYEVAYQKTANGWRIN